MRYAIAPTDEAYRLVGLVKTQLGGHLGRAGAARTRSPGSSRSCGSGPNERGALPEPEFWVLDAEPVPHAAAPTLSFRLRAQGPLGARGLHDRAHRPDPPRGQLSAPHDDEARERLRDVFGEPERWGDTARSVLWAKREVLVPSFTGSTTFELELPLQHRPRAGHHALLRGRRRTARCRWPSTSAARSSIAATRTACSSRRCPGTASAQFRLPLETWRSGRG